jgi:RNA polymerase sigma-70 factor (ECF subfamily)
MDEDAVVSWRRQYGSVYRYVRRRSGSREEAEDVTQEVFEAAAAALGQASLDVDEPPLAWLYTVAQRRLIDRYREARFETVPLKEASPAPTPRYGPSVVDVLREGISLLEESQRRVIVLKLFEGRPFSEISELVEASEEACRMRLSRGLSALRQYLEGEGVTP